MLLQSRRGQLWAIDALLAAILFTAIFFLYVTTAENLQLNRQNFFNEAFARAQRIAFTLTESPGSPEGWNSASFTRIGLTTGERLVLNETKLFNFAGAGYSRAVEEMGVGEYYLRVRLLNTTGSVFTVSNGALLREADFGQAPANATLVMPVTRIVTFNSTTAVLEVTLWKP